MNSSLFITNIPVVDTITQFVRLLKIQVTKGTIEEEVLSHPEYPSMLVISDCLNKWNVDNAAFRLDKDFINEISTPFITFYNKEFYIITFISDDKIFYINKNNKIAYFEKNLFLEEWDGIVLVAEVENNVGEKEFKIKKKKEQFQFVPIILILSLAIASIFVSSITLELGNSFSPIIYWGIATCKLAGIVISCLLLWYEIDKYNPTLQKICGGSNKKTNCEAILNSNMSKIFGWLSWSEIGFVYFTGCFITLLFFPNALYLLAYLSILALPYILFSLIYQFFVVKELCPLCLTVQGLMFLELTFFLLGGAYEHSLIDIYSFTNLLFITVKIIVLLLIISSIWFFLKPYFKSASNEKNYKYELARLKGNTDIFNSILTNQKSATKLPDELGIIIGNSNAKTTIVKVCNPYCDPCAKAHLELEEMLTDNIKLQIIYNTSNSSVDSNRHPAKHFLALQDTGNNKMLMSALHDWYSAKNKNYQEFAKKYPVHIQLDIQSNKIEAMSEWCDENEVTHTPTYFFNGKRLPSIYKLKDLEYFIK